MKQFIIIGNSAAGIAAVEAIRKRDNESKITVISDENHSSYCRCMISYYLAGEVKEDKIIYRPDDFYRQNNVELILGKKVARADPKKNRLTCDDKSQLGYDGLLIATGACAKFPEIKGIKKSGVFGFRTIKDAQEISGLLPVTKTACVLGGGLIGLKAAYALKKRNIDVKVVIKSKQVLSQMLDVESALLVLRRLQEHGIEVILGQDAVEVIGEGAAVQAVKLDSGKAIGCTMVIVGKGVSPNTEIVKETQVKYNEGIITNESLQSNIPNIYAAGDVCESIDLTLGVPGINALWPVAVEQGKIAGGNMAGGDLKYDGSVGMNSLEFFGLPVVSLGIYKSGEGAPLEELKSSDPKENLYKKLILKDNRLIGAILAGNIKNSGIFLRLIRERVNISGFKDKLLEGNFGYHVIKDLLKDKEHLYV